jgi:hypothetical protein
MSSFEEKFNQALIYYSQIWNGFENDVVGFMKQLLKAAKTSCLKPDFD